MSTKHEKTYQTYVSTYQTDNKSENCSEIVKCAADMCKSR